jgi:hypothetical protein
LTAPADDEHVSGSSAPSAELERREDRVDGMHAGAHARPVDVPPVEVPRHPLPERQRYFLSSLEPSGEYDAVIVAVTDGGRRRYFTTRDGARLTEVDEDSFERRRDSEARSMLELDERELGELEAELKFVRPVRGRDPIAEAENEAEADTQAEAEEEADAEAEAAEEVSDATADAAADATPPDDTADATPDAAADAATVEAPEVDPPFVHRATFTPPETMTEEATDDDEEDEEVDPMTEEFEEMVMASTMTSERVDEAASVIDEAEDDLPTPSFTPMSATDAIAQVSLAKGIAFIAHRGKHDRSGAPYIDHPGRIAERFDPVTQTVEAAAAWLHDVLEDTSITAQELFEAGVMPQIVEVVQLLTRTPEISPDEYYARIRRDPIARRVKLADIDDNTARWRLRRLEYETQLRLVEKYRYARQALGND